MMEFNMVAQNTKPTCKPAGPNQPAGEQVYQPDIDLNETAEGWTFAVDMPGVKAGGIGIDLDNETLSIRGEVTPRQADDVRYIFREYGVGDYEAAIAVGDSVDTERISADYANGVLTLHLPKSGAARPRRIEVSSTS